MIQDQDAAKTVEAQDDDSDVGEAQRDAVEAGVTLDDNGEPFAASEQGDDEEDSDAAPTAFEPSDPTMLLGEMRDDVLAGLKGPVGWSKLKEAQRTFIANAVEQACRRVIRGAMRIAASMDLDAVEVTISGTTHKTDKDQIEAKVLCPFDADTWAAMPAHGKRMLVFADHEKLMGARAAAVMKDQPGLFGDGTETPAEKAKREAIDADVERAESEARAHKFKPLDDAPPTIDNDTGAIVTPAPPPVLLLGAMLPPAVKAAADRGIAHRQAGGGRKIPKDLEALAEVSAWLKGWDSADASADGHAVDGATGEVQPEPAKPPRGHRGKRTTVEERVAKRAAETAGA